MTDRIPRTAIGHALAGPTVAAFAVEVQTQFSTPPHQHPRGQMIGCSQGVVSILTDLGAWVVPAGHAIWLPPHHRHGGQGYGPGSGWTVYIAPDACRGLPDRPQTVLVASLLREAILRAVSWEDDQMDQSRQRIADLIVDEIGRLPAEALGLPMPRDPRLQRIARALLQDPGDARSLSEWAAWAGSTSRTLSRRFPRETGLSFTQWRQRAQLLRSLEMLAEGRAVTTIALDLGYSSVSSFITLFRRTFGVTPAAHPIHAK